MSRGADLDYDDGFMPVAGVIVDEDGNPVGSGYGQEEEEEGGMYGGGYDPRMRPGEADPYTDPRYRSGNDPRYGGRDGGGGGGGGGGAYEEPVYGGGDYPRENGPQYGADEMHEEEEEEGHGERMRHRGGGETGAMATGHHHGYGRRRRGRGDRGGEEHREGGDDDDDEEGHGRRQMPAARELSVDQIERITRQKLLNNALSTTSGAKTVHEFAITMGLANTSLRELAVFNTPTPKFKMSNETKEAVIRTAFDSGDPVIKEFYQKNKRLPLPSDVNVTICRMDLLNARNDLPSGIGMALIGCGKNATPHLDLCGTGAAFDLIMEPKSQAPHAKQAIRFSAAVNHEVMRTICGNYTTKQIQEDAGVFRVPDSKYVEASPETPVGKLYMAIKSRQGTKKVGTSLHGKLNIITNEYEALKRICVDYKSHNSTTLDEIGFALTRLDLRPDVRSCAAGSGAVFDDATGTKSGGDAADSEGISTSAAAASKSSTHDPWLNPNSLLPSVQTLFETRTYEKEAQRLQHVAGSVTATFKVWLAFA